MKSVAEQYHRRRADLDFLARQYRISRARCKEIYRRTLRCEAAAMAARHLLELPLAFARAAAHFNRRNHRACRAPSHDSTLQSFGYVEFLLTISTAHSPLEGGQGGVVQYR